MRRRAFLAALLAPLPALAHVGVGPTAGFLAGLVHPLSGADHVLAMVTVGLWAGLLGGAARWLLPGAFLGALVVGGALGAAGVALPMVGAGILASVIVLGALAALAARLPLPAGMALAALFGLLHGHPHGEELMGGVAASYVLGFVAMTAALHVAGVALGAGLAGRVARIAGGAAAAAGVALALV